MSDGITDMMIQLEAKKEAIYALDLFEEYVIHKNSSVWVSFTRVPGGWIWHYVNPNDSSALFIPFDNEFMLR